MMAVLTFLYWLAVIYLALGLVVGTVMLVINLPIKLTRDNLKMVGSFYLFWPLWLFAMIAFWFTRR